MLPQRPTTEPKSPSRTPSVEYDFDCGVMHIDEVPESEPDIASLNTDAEGEADFNG